MVWLLPADLPLHHSHELAQQPADLATLRHRYHRIRCRHRLQPLGLADYIVTRLRRWRQLVIPQLAIQPGREVNRELLVLAASGGRVGFRAGQDRRRGRFFQRSPVSDSSMAFVNFSRPDFPGFIE